MRKSNVSRLAWDISPRVWTFILFQLAVSFFMDYLWLLRESRLAPTIPGILLASGGSFSMVKVATWRLLPVSRVELDRARWWVSMGAPALLLLLLLIVAALLRTHQGVSPSWDRIALVALAQMGFATFCVSYWVLIPLVLKKLGVWSVLLVVLFLLVVFRVLFLGTAANPDLILILLAAGGIPAALAFYLAAGHWPLPLTTYIWATPRESRTAKPIAMHAGRRGWWAFGTGALPLLSLFWAVCVVYPVLYGLIVPTRHSVIPSLSGVVTIMACMAIGGVLPSVRVFRTLPLTGWQLMLRLCAILAFIELTSFAALMLGTVLLRQAEFDFTPILMLPLSFLFIPIALRFSSNIALFTVAPVYGAALIFALFPNGVLPEWLLPSGAMIAGLASLYWTWWEITRGRHTYRMVPLAPMRWRGR